ncbi:MAG: type secretory pathway, ATPase PulE/Tfp pilus assembly pathway, ATPase PilB, partial [Proteobacteria bacterium]|nr:type secretory pathway, ATPase PulE/Tfp pilus assembly pathway, ATPase PilB [Pseudomonadota bacterium]
MSDVASRLVFLKNLHNVTNKIHATNNVDEIMLELGQDICSLFNSDRLTIYLLSEDEQFIVSKVKTGLNSFKDLKLPVNERSVAGYVASTKLPVNIQDVYDEAELKQYSPEMQFLKEVDKRTGYRSKQMLVSPVIDSTGKLMGVVQIINNKADQP